MFADFSKCMGKNSAAVKSEKIWHCICHEARGMRHEARGRQQAARESPE